MGEIAPEREERKFQKPLELLFWQAPSRFFTPKKKRWFLGLTVLIGGVVVLLLLVAEWTLAFFFLAFGFVIYVLSSIEPRLAEYRILNVGFKIGDKLFSWDDLDHFWVDQKEDQNILFFRTKLAFPDKLEVLLGDQDPVEVEALLLELLPREEIKPSGLLSFLDGMVTGIAQKLPRTAKKTKREKIKKEETPSKTPTPKASAPRAKKEEKPTMRVKEEYGEKRRKIKEEIQSRLKEDTKKS